MNTKPGSFEAPGEVGVSGTLVWYYYICPRQVWLISHQLTPDAENDNLAYGRFIGETSYAREKKELAVGASKMDVYHFANGEFVVGEVKKSSRYRYRLWQTYGIDTGDVDMDKVQENMRRQLESYRHERGKVHSDSR
ncbi:MAG TPA: Dna2/Cas4 domain-containing protein [Desulfotomaculum sp.]|nr:Dna2/Cas4 domain-containing protein [Desulfotomaculum sp.]